MFEKKEFKVQIMNKLASAKKKSCKYSSSSRKLLQNCFETLCESN